MTISRIKRRDAVMELLNNGFDIDKAVERFLIENANEAEVLRVKYPEKLARNIITIGGSGVQQELNLAAFQEALALFAEEQHRKATNRLRNDNEKLEAEIEQQRRRNNDLLDENSRLNSDLHQRDARIEGLLTEVNAKDREAMALRLEAATPGATTA